MKKNQILALLLAAVMLLAVLTGCAAKAEPAQDEPAQTETVPETEEAAPAEEEPAPAEKPEAEDTASTVTLTDMTGRKITLDAPAERVVALTAADCEILYALGAGDLLVGRGEYCDYPAEVLDVPSVQSGYETNIEQIIALEPQVLLMSTMAQTEEQVQQLEAAGIHVVVSDAQDIEGTYTAINMIGTLTGKQAEAPPSSRACRKLLTRSRQMPETARRPFILRFPRCSMVSGRQAPARSWTRSPICWA